MICYCTKNFRGGASAGNKARHDIEQIFASRGYKNIGAQTTYHRGAVLSFFATLWSVMSAMCRLKKGDTLLLQYPQNKFYTMQCQMARVVGANSITIIHDLKSFRRQKVAVDREARRLSRSSCVIAHNDSMKSWLKDNGVTSHLVTLDVFDYLSDTQAYNREYSSNDIRVVFAGGLSRRKSSFLYEVGAYAKNFRFMLYGRDFDIESTNGANALTYKGFTPSDELIATVDGDYGLVWDGDSVDECSGAWGEYLKFNNPHKTSLYIRCELPIIIWREAALASFVEQNNIGICVDSLSELDELLPKISSDEYLEMKRNVVVMSKKMSQGHFCITAVESANAVLSAG